jgi:hypothetical protein
LVNKGVDELHTSTAPPHFLALFPHVVAWKEFSYGFWNRIDAFHLDHLPRTLKRLTVETVLSFNLDLFPELTHLDVADISLVSGSRLRRGSSTNADKVMLLSVKSTTLDPVQLLRLPPTLTSLSFELSPVAEDWNRRILYDPERICLVFLI